MVNLDLTYGELKKTITEPRSALYSIASKDLDRIDFSLELDRLEIFSSLSKDLLIQLIARASDYPREVHQIIRQAKEWIQECIRNCNSCMYSLLDTDDDRLLEYRFISWYSYELHELLEFLEVFCLQNNPEDSNPFMENPPPEVTPSDGTSQHRLYVNEDGELEQDIYSRADQNHLFTDMEHSCQPLRVAMLYVVLYDLGKWDALSRNAIKALARLVFPTIPQRTLRGLINVLYPDSSENRSKYTTEAYIEEARRRLKKLRIL